jgi:hypothetical protein
MPRHAYVVELNWNLHKISSKSRLASLEILGVNMPRKSTVHFLRVKTSNKSEIDIFFGIRAS